MGKVLVADSAAHTRIILRNILNNAGFEVIAEAENGKEAIDYYKLYMPDIVVMDIVLSVLDGIESLKEIIKFDPKAKIIVCSAMAETDVVVKVLQIGAKHFLVKPFWATDVIEVVRRWCISGRSESEQ